MKIIQIIILMGTIILAQSVSAQEMQDAFATSKYKSFQLLKEEIEVLIAQNQELSKEYSLLQKELDALNRQAYEKRGELTEIGYYSDPEKIFGANDSTGFLEKVDGLKSYENEILIKRSKLGQLRSQLLEMDEKIRLWKLKFSDLQFQKREMMLQSKLEKHTTEDARMDYEQEINQLRDELTQKKQKESEESRVIAELAQQVSSYELNTKRLKEENRDLEQKIKKLEEDLDIKNREVSLLKDKRTFVNHKTGSDIEDLERQKNTLRDSVQRLEAEYAKIEKDLQDSLESQEDRRSLIQGVISVDQENQELREKITELQEKLE